MYWLSDSYAEKKFILMKGKKVHLCFFTRNTLSPFWLVVVYIAWMWRAATRKLTFNKEKDRSNKCEVFGFSNWRLLENLNVKILGDHKINVGSESIDSGSKIFLALESMAYFCNILNLFSPRGEILKNEYEFTLNLVQISSLWFSNMFFLSEFSVAHD